MSNIQMHPVESSQIAAIGYHPETQTLAVEFKGKPDKDQKPTKGATYHYQNVNPQEYEALKAAKSKGSHFYKLIKPNPKKYPYTKQG